MNPGASRLYWIYRAYNQMQLCQQCNQLQAQLDAGKTTLVREGLARLPLNRDDPEVQWALEQMETQLQYLEQQPQQLDSL